MKKLLTSVLAWLTGVSTKALIAARPIVAGATADAVTELMPSAIKIVASLEGSRVSGEEKRRQAVKQLRADAYTIGVDVATSIANLLVEMAVAELKAAAK